MNSSDQIEIFLKYLFDFSLTKSWKTLFIVLIFPLVLLAFSLWVVILFLKEIKKFFLFLKTEKEIKSIPYSLNLSNLISGSEMFLSHENCVELYNFILKGIFNSKSRCTISNTLSYICFNKKGGPNLYFKDFRDLIGESVGFQDRKSELSDDYDILIFPKYELRKSLINLKNGEIDSYMESHINEIFYQLILDHDIFFLGPKQGAWPYPQTLSELRNIVSEFFEKPSKRTRYDKLRDYCLLSFVKTHDVVFLLHFLKITEKQFNIGS